ncbi:hypothetical protein ACN9JG_08715 [Cereibacter azotoformans]|uniref:hypothetical protein n=1 Tax=Cereibacter azotoformans TaxID=43057 RepID=UPI003B20C1C9
MTHLARLIADLLPSGAGRQDEPRRAVGTGNVQPDGVMEENHVFCSEIGWP